MGDFTKHNPWRSPGKAPVRDACPHGCYLHADPAAADDERLVRAEFFDRGDFQMLVPVRLPW